MKIKRPFFIATAMSLVIALLTAPAVFLVGMAALFPMLAVLEYLRFAPQSARRAAPAPYLAARPAV